MSEQQDSLPSEAMAQVTAEIRAMTRRMSRDQVLDLADLLHEVVRERQFEQMTWRRRVSLQAETAQQA
ncbi:MAG: hypothetical protein Q8Q88_14415 [Phenylobacterium sp.]|uniref:hypothetical protein n=1 Tax=Phenylobacterium sp. TaxID=1871053 RepID=UPI002732AFBF|nr:hypothetical protein [Phenylobacterium sp.]MDP3748230.1 hypothetical protein [Phenylobacterium sp.]